MIIRLFDKKYKKVMEAKEPQKVYEFFLECRRTSLTVTVMNQYLYFRVSYTYSGMLMQTTLIFMLNTFLPHQNKYITND